jgi:hypothetical protein
MNRRDELDAMYVILYKGCAGMDCMDCPGREYDHCGDYNKAVKLYDAGWRKQIEAKWIPVEKLVPDWGANIIHHYECSNCRTLEYTNDRKYCSNCGAKMEK